MVKWCFVYYKESFLYEYFEEICEIMKVYDVSFLFGDGLCFGLIYDVNDEVQFGELKMFGEFMQIVWKYDVQVMIEGFGYVLMQLIKENMDFQFDWCKEVLFYMFGLFIIDIVLGYDYIMFGIGVVMIGWFGIVMLCYVMLKEYFGLLNKDDVKEGIIMYKFVVYVVDFVKGYLGVQVCDNVLLKVCFEFCWEDQFNIGFDLDKVCEFYDEMLLKDLVKVVYFCLMCGLYFCLMKIMQDVCEFVVQ